MQIREVKRSECMYGYFTKALFCMCAVEVILILFFTMGFTLTEISIFKEAADNTLNFFTPMIIIGSIYLLMCNLILLIDWITE